jgi:hypothetical protein
MNTKTLLQRQNDCAWTFLNSKGKSPVFVTPTARNLINGHYALPNGVIVKFKTTVREQDINLYPDHIIEEQVLDMFLQEYDYGHNLFYFNFFQTGDVNRYNFIAYNIHDRIKLWEEDGYPWINRGFAQRTYGGSGAVVSKRHLPLVISSLDYKEMGIIVKRNCSKLPVMEKPKPKWVTSKRI